jgi:hypothetical protein
MNTSNVSTKFYVQEQTSKDVWWEVNESGYDTFREANKEYDAICRQQSRKIYRLIVRQTTVTDTQLLRRRT